MHTSCVSNSSINDNINLSMSGTGRKESSDDHAIFHMLMLSVRFERVKARLTREFLDNIQTREKFKIVGLEQPFQDIQKHIRFLCDSESCINLREISEPSLLQAAYSNAIYGGFLTIDIEGAQQYADLLKSDSNVMSTLKHACILDCQVINNYIKTISFPEAILNYTLEPPENSSGWTLEVNQYCRDVQVLKNIGDQLTEYLKSFDLPPPTPKTPTGSSWFRGRGNAKAKRSKEMPRKFGNMKSLVDSPHIFFEMRRLLLT